MNKRKVLIVDDEKSIRDSLRLLLKSHFEVDTAEDGAAALGKIKEVIPDIVLLDLIMPKLDGIETLQKLREFDTNVPVVVLTATNSISSAVQAMKLGAVDCLSKPFDVNYLITLISTTCERALLESKSIENVDNCDQPKHKRSIIGESKAIEEIVLKINQVAKRDTTILLMGESGTGKELIANQIHQSSKRATKAFVPINCAAIPESLIESELFGHEKGSFTNAHERRIGHFELANKGTLFLDEIGELALPVQVKLLRFLQEQEFYRVGSSNAIHVDVRVLAATNKNLEELVKAGQFREDLYYRLNVISLDVPPLRDRDGDISLLLNYFIEKHAAMYAGRKLTFSDDALEVLHAYEWPGNVRELENLIENLLALAPQDIVEVADLPIQLGSTVHPLTLVEKVVEGEIGFEDAAQKFEKEVILKALERSSNVQTRAAEMLGITRRMLKYKMDKLGICE